MVLIQLNGGLGNQLFQYALGRRIALDRKTALRFETSAFGFQEKRAYKLHHFNVEGLPASPREVKRFLRWERNPALAGLYRLYNAGRPDYQKPVVDEQSILFNENILRVSKNVFLRGYWQTEKYFCSIENVLRQELVVHHPLTGLNLEMAERIKSCLAVSLHVRRGDYVTDPPTNKTHGTAPPEYYRTAINLMLQLFPAATFFIFSDDIPWAKENLPIRAPQIFVDHNTDKTDYEDLRLMSLCKHHIIANSSFSWWGAWLCQDPNKKVVAPRQWYKIEIDTRDLLPEEWIKI